MSVAAVALINVSFHGFIEFDETGRHIACVNSDTIIDGTEDSVRHPSLGHFHLVSFPLSLSFFLML
jgi:hypothetical protein